MLSLKHMAQRKCRRGDGHCAEAFISVQKASGLYKLSPICGSGNTDPLYVRDIMPSLISWSMMGVTAFFLVGGQVKLCTVLVMPGACLVPASVNNLHGISVTQP